MIVFNVLQLVLAGYVAWLVGSRLHRVHYRLRLDAVPLARAIAARLRAGDRATARALVSAAAPSAFHDLVAPLVEPDPRPADLQERETDEAFADLRADLDRGVTLLRGLASVAVAAGFCGATVSMAGFIGPDAAAGAAPLSGGALEHALVTMALGLMAAFPALSGYRILRRASSEIADDVDRAVGIVEIARREVERGEGAPDVEPSAGGGEPARDVEENQDGAAVSNEHRRTPEEP